MFGANNVTSSWANPQQNQQNQSQQQGSAFGQPSTFGTGTAFGSNPFGQNQQQQQQPANPMFGNLGGSTTATAQPSTGFGSSTPAFGSTNTGFGAIKPATGFGAFGGTGSSTFGGSSNAFGTTGAAPATTGFGQTAGATGGFGNSSAGTGLFGAKPTTSAFGGPATTATPDGNASVPPVTTGSSNPPYNVFTEKDSTAPGSATLHYQSISCMPAYRGSSFEELRYQDYAQGRKTAGGFGQPAVFGLNPTQSNQPATGGIFGQAQQQTQVGAPSFAGFGQTTQPPQATGFGAFNAANATTQPATSGFGTSTTGGFGTFGQNQAQQGQAATGGFGVFGQNNSQQQQGQQQPTAGSNAFGSFGSSAPALKPFGSFGTGSSTFGSAGNTFGQTNTQQPSTSIFGQAQNQAQPQQPSTGSFGTFGTNNAAKPPMFGSAAANNTTQSTGFGIFGQNQQSQQPNQQPQQQSGGIFGTGTNLFGQNQGQQQGTQQQPQPGSLFANNQTPASTAPIGGLFGTSSGSIFGGQQQDANKSGFGTGLFGQSQASGTAAPAQQGSIFGQSIGQSTNQANSNSLFGQQKPALNLFGQSTPQPNTLAGSSFGNAQNNTGGGFGSSITQPQGQLTASIAQPVSTNLPIFSLLPTVPRSVPLDQAPKKSSSYFVDVPTRSPLNMSMGSANLGASRLRGFANSQSIAGGRVGNPFSQSLTFSANHGNGTSAADKVSDSKSILGPDAFLSAKALGSHGRSSPKKLVLDKKVDPAELFAKSDLKGGTKIAFNPAMSAAAREREGLSNMASFGASRAPTSPSKKEVTKDKAKAGADNTELQVGDYWIKPPLDILRNCSNTELSAMENLVVGRVGFGEVQFLEAVDLTTLPRLSSLLGKVIQIDSKECCVYPETEDGDDSKPQPGEGLNVKARIVLLGCWPLDKATREPIKDDKHPAFAKHLKRLKGIKHTQFEGYDISEGKWTFTVDHF